MILSFVNYLLCMRIHLFAVDAYHIYCYANLHIMVTLYTH